MIRDEHERFQLATHIGTIEREKSNIPQGLLQLNNLACPLGQETPNYELQTSFSDLI